MTTTGAFLTRVLLTPIRGYQRWISPALPPRCRFYPTCSQYAVEAISQHGALRGGWLSLVRIAKCAPWHQGGIDHVPSVTGHLQPTLMTERHAAHQVTDVSATTRPSAHHPLENHA